MTVLLAVLGGVSVPDARVRSGTTRACKASCRSARKACLKTATASFRSAAAACGAPRKPCRRAAKAAYRQRRGVCKSATADCRSCCADGRQACDRWCGDQVVNQAAAEQCDPPGSACDGGGVCTATCTCPVPCRPDVPGDCDDGDPCTSDRCDDGGQCRHDPVSQTAACVTVHVEATDPNGAALTYRWRVSEGEIADVNDATTAWLVPPGPGVHFANVLVSNGRGGYTARRIAVASDDLGFAPLAVPPRSFAPPSAVGTIDFQGMGVVVADNFVAGRLVYLPDVAVTYHDFTNGTDVTTTSDATGALPLYNADHCDYYCDNSVLVPSLTHPHTHIVPGDRVLGSVALADGSLCGTDDPFNDVTASATAVLIDGGGQPVGDPARVNAFGDYAVPWDPRAVAVRIECESASPVVVTFDPPTRLAGDAVIPSSGRPSVATMTAHLGGQPIGTYLSQELGRPSDGFPGAHRFLSFKGFDTRRGACEYYRTTGAVESCDNAGNPTGAITFDDWKRAVGMEPYPKPGGSEVTATYVNRIDLNLTREHHAVAYGGATPTTAAYVCNHLGPADDTQASVDAAIDAALAGRDQIACVAMDYGQHDNAANPYVRFYTFLPDGRLALSVNLDGRGEKFMPGACAACHGSDLYGGHFPTYGQAGPDFGGHFLPYDVGNFAFSTKAGLTKSDQQAAIHALNTIVLGTNTTDLSKGLITAWYAGGTDVLDEAYVPPDWQVGGDVERLYKEVNARYCRTCHVVMNDGVSSNPEHVANWSVLASWNEPAFAETLCGGSPLVARNHTMPNSLTTFDRLWSDANARALLAEFFPGPCLDAPDPPLLPGPPLTTLTSGQAVQPVAGDWKTVRKFRIAVPAAATQLQVTATPGIGLVTLELHQAPGDSDAGIGSCVGDSSTGLVCTTPTNGVDTTYYVTLYGDTPFAGWSLVATYQ